MMTKNTDKKREQIQMFCMNDMVPANHLLRTIDKAIDWKNSNEHESRFLLIAFLKIKKFTIK